MKINWNDRVILIDGRVLIDNISFSIKNIKFNNVLDSGANAIIIKGKDIELGRDVIVKIWLINSNDFRNKIIQGREESRKIAKLNHIRIAKVYTSGVYKNLWYYLVMEDLGETTLRKVLATNPDFNLKYEYWYEIEDGIKHAHKKNIYHSDLHTNNVMVFQYHIKIIDFGTSWFNHKHSLERESYMIELLVKEIFNDFLLLDYQDYSFKILKPQNCLSHCSSWVEIMYVMKKLIDKTYVDHSIRSYIDDYSIRSYFHHIVYEICENPLFNIKAITKFLVTAGLQEEYIKMFLDHLLICMQGTINNQNTWDISYNLEPSIEQKLIESLVIQRSLVEKYLANTKLSVI